MNDFSFPYPVGSSVSFDTVQEYFHGPNMAGMRLCKENGTLALICDHSNSKKIYDDKWCGDELHYTGTGQRGDQKLEGTQNKTLYESDTNGIQVHLFEKLGDGKYKYCGIVKLSGKPVQEEQKDVEGNLRKVWVFPIKPTVPVYLSQTEFDCYLGSQKQKTKGLDSLKLKEDAQATYSPMASHRYVLKDVYIPNPFVIEYIKKRANGFCELCGKEGPFKDKDGKPYLEIHHIVPLSKGGEDTIENTVELCPNCHRKMHVLNLESDRKVLIEKAKK